MELSSEPVLSSTKPPVKASFPSVSVKAKASVVELPGVSSTPTTRESEDGSFTDPVTLSYPVVSYGMVSASSTPTRST